MRTGDYFWNYYAKKMLYNLRRRFRWPCLVLSVLSTEALSVAEVTQVMSFKLHKLCEEKMHWADLDLWGRCLPQFLLVNSLITAEAIRNSFTCLVQVVISYPSFTFNESIYWFLNYWRWLSLYIFCHNKTVRCEFSMETETDMVSIEKFNFQGSHTIISYSNNHDNWVNQ